MCIPTRLSHETKKSAYKYSGYTYICNSSNISKENPRFWRIFSIFFLLFLSHLLYCCCYYPKHYYCCCFFYSIRNCILQPITLLVKMVAEQELNISVLFLITLGPYGGPQGDEWVMYHQRRGWGRTNQSNFTGDRFQVIVQLCTYENGCWARSGYLGGIFGQFGALRGAPAVTDGWFTIPGERRGKTNQRDFTGDRFQVIVPLFTYKNSGSARSGYLCYFWLLLGSDGGPSSDGWVMYHPGDEL